MQPTTTTAGRAVVVAAVLCGGGQVRAQPVRDHLNWYQIALPAGVDFDPFVRDLEDEFGLEAGCTIVKPRELCVPAEKSPSAPPVGCRPGDTCATRSARGPGRRSPDPGRSRAIGRWKRATWADPSPSLFSHARLTSCARGRRVDLGG
jgi:hypothetical protein